MRKAVKKAVTQFQKKNEGADVAIGDESFGKIELVKSGVWARPVYRPRRRRNIASPPSASSDSVAGSGTKTTVSPVVLSATMKPRVSSLTIRCHDTGATSDSVVGPAAPL